MAARFLARARTEVERHLINASVPANERENLDVRGREKLHAMAITALPTKFALLNVTDNDEQLTNSYNLMMRTNEFFSRIEKYDMAEPFYRIVQEDEDDPGNILPDVINLREYITRVTEEQVRESNDFYSRHGQTYDVQNLMWTQELLENSCEDDLRDKVMESLTQIPQSEQGGPLFYFIMINLITSSTAEAARTLINRIRTLQIRDIPGENVFTAVSQVRGALRQLTIVNAVPVDIQFILIDIFNKTSSISFNETFNILNGQIRIQRLRDPNILEQYSPESILRLAESNYRELIEKGEWNAPTKAGSSFVTCWNCGEEGHVRNECPHPQKDNSGRGGRGGRDGGRGGGRGRTQERGRSGGRGGRFGGRRNNRGGRGFGRTGGRGRFQGRGGGIADSEKRLADELKTPPSKRGVTVRNIGGRQHFWCHRCHQWNGDHLTKDHDDNKVYHYEVTPMTGSSNTAQVQPTTSFRDTIFQGTLT